MTGEHPLVSVVVPVFNEAPNIPDLVKRFDEVITTYPGATFEFVVVDDGSNDDTAALVSAAAEARADVVFVELSRNFGSHAAITAGLTYSSGDAAIVIGGDLQEPIELFGRFLDQWHDGHDIVWGVRRTRGEQSGPSAWLSALFTRMLTSASVLDTYPPEGPSGVLISRVAIDAVLGMTERNRNVLGLVAWSGFRQGRVEFDLADRNAGESKWTFSKKVKLAVDSFVQFSFAPVRAMTYIGMVVAALGFLYAALLVVRRLAFDFQVEGWTTVVVLVLVLGGTQLVMLGVLGEYLWRGVDESRGRPIYVVKEVRRP